MTALILSMRLRLFVHTTVLNDLQSKFEQDKAKAAGLKQRSERRFKPY